MVFRSGPLAPGVAFITGGARGLGNAIAVSFAKEGARGVVIVDINDEETFEQGKKNVEQYGAKCLTIRADVTKEDEVEKAVEEAVKEFGRIDYAANFAGIVGPLGNAWDVSAEDWKRVMEVNTVGVWLCNKYQLRQMMKQDSLEVEEGRPPQRGSIVNCASVNSILGGNGSSGYAASKHAVMGITKSAALEARGHGIRVNAVSPGYLLTKLLDPFMKYGDEQKASETWSTFEARQGRKATFDEIGDVVVLLSVPRMSLVVGHNLVVDNGFTINPHAY